MSDNDSRYADREPKPVKYANNGQPAILLNWDSDMSNKYLRRAPDNNEHQVKIPQSLSPSLPYWDSEVFLFEQTSNTDEVCPVDPTDAENGNSETKNLTTWKELGIGVLAGIIVSKLLR